MRDAFEASWKLHLNAYHQTTRKMRVNQITSGPNAGAYKLIEGPFSYADMDMPETNAKVHRTDLDKTIGPKTEQIDNYYAYYRDSLSINTDTQAEKFLVSATVLKNGKMGDYLAEVSRGVKVQKKMNSTVSTIRSVRGFAGSKPTLISVLRLKDGYKQLEGGPNNPEFRKNYIETYGQEAWDNRLKIMVDLVEDQSMHFEVLRADLSSK